MLLSENACLYANFETETVSNHLKINFEAFLDTFLETESYLSQNKNLGLYSHLTPHSEQDMRKITSSSVGRDALFGFPAHALCNSSVL